MGNMPAERARPRRIRGGSRLLQPMRIIGTAEWQDHRRRAIPANPWGFFHMQGNVYEWTADWYEAAYPTGNLVIGPDRTGIGLVPGLTRWFPGRWRTHLRSAGRGRRPPGHRNDALGFRVGFTQTNDPPALVTPSVGVIENQTLALTVNASDPDEIL